jgi:hypothetical protein
MPAFRNPLYHYLINHMPPVRVPKSVLWLIALPSLPVWCFLSSLWGDNDFFHLETPIYMVLMLATPGFFIALIFPIGVAYLVAEVGGYLNRWVGLSEHLRLTPMTNFSIVSAFVMVALTKMRLLLGWLVAAWGTILVYGLAFNPLNGLLLTLALILLNVMAALLGVAITLRVHRPEKSAVLAGVITFGLVLLLGFLYLKSLSIITTERYPCHTCLNDERSVPLLTTQFCLLPLALLIGILGVITRNLLARRLSGT